MEDEGEGYRTDREPSAAVRILANGRRRARRLVPSFAILAAMLAVPAAAGVSEPMIDIDTFFVVGVEGSALVTFFSAWSVLPSSLSGQVSRVDATLTYEVVLTPLPGLSSFFDVSLFVYAGYSVESRNYDEAYTRHTTIELPNEYERVEIRGNLHTETTLNVPPNPNLAAMSGSEDSRLVSTEMHRPPVVLPESVATESYKAISRGAVSISAVLELYNQGLVSMGTEECSYEYADTTLYVATDLDSGTGLPRSQVQTSASAGGVPATGAGVRPLRAQASANVALSGGGRFVGAGLAADRSSLWRESGPFLSSASLGGQVLVFLDANANAVDWTVEAIDGVGHGPDDALGSVETSTLAVAHSAEANAPGRAYASAGAAILAEEPRLPDDGVLTEGPSALRRVLSRSLREPAIITSANGERRQIEEMLAAGLHSAPTPSSRDFEVLASSLVIAEVQRFRSEGSGTFDVANVGFSEDALAELPAAGGPRFELLRSTESSYAKGMPPDFGTVWGEAFDSRPAHEGGGVMTVSHGTIRWDDVSPPAIDAASLGMFTLDTSGSMGWDTGFPNGRVDRIRVLFTGQAESAAGTGDLRADAGLGVDLAGRDVDGTARTGGGSMSLMARGGVSTQGLPDAVALAAEQAAVLRPPTGPSVLPSAAALSIQATSALDAFTEERLEITLGAMDSVHADPPPAPVSVVEWDIASELSVAGALDALAADAVPDGVGAYLAVPFTVTVDVPTPEAIPDEIVSLASGATAEVRIGGLLGPIGSGGAVAVLADRTANFEVWNQPIRQFRALDFRDVTIVRGNVVPMASPVIKRSFEVRIGDVAAVTDAGPDSEVVGSTASVVVDLRSSADPNPNAESFASARSFLEGRFHGGIASSGLDLLTVLAHEMGHGLGFANAVNERESPGSVPGLGGEYRFFGLFRGNSDGSEWSQSNSASWNSRNYPVDDPRFHVYSMFSLQKGFRTIAPEVTRVEAGGTHEFSIAPEAKGVVALRRTRFETGQTHSFATASGSFSAAGTDQFALSGVEVRPGGLVTLQAGSQASYEFVLPADARRLSHSIGGNLDIPSMQARLVRARAQVTGGVDVDAATGAGQQSSEIQGVLQGMDTSGAIETRELTTGLDVVAAPNMSRYRSDPYAESVMRAFSTTPRAFVESPWGASIQGAFSHGAATVEGEERRIEFSNGAAVHADPSPEIVGNLNWDFEGLMTLQGTQGTLVNELADIVTVRYAEKTDALPPPEPQQELFRHTLRVSATVLRPIAIPEPEGASVGGSADLTIAAAVSRHGNPATRIGRYEFEFECSVESTTPSGTFSLDASDSVDISDPSGASSIIGVEWDLSAGAGGTHTTGQSGSDAHVRQILNLLANLGLGGSASVSQSLRATLDSSTDPEGPQLRTELRSDGTFEKWKVFAPIPLLRVQASTEAEHTCFCANIPWLEVQSQAGAFTVETGSEPAPVRILELSTGSSGGAAASSPGDWRTLGTTMLTGLGRTPAFPPVTFEGARLTAQSGFTMRSRALEWSFQQLADFTVFRTMEGTSGALSSGSWAYSVSDVERARTGLAEFRLESTIESDPLPLGFALTGEVVEAQMVLDFEHASTRTMARFLTRPNPEDPTSRGLPLTGAGVGVSAFGILSVGPLRRTISGANGVALQFSTPTVLSGCTLDSVLQETLRFEGSGDLRHGVSISELEQFSAAMADVAGGTVALKADSLAVGGSLTVEGGSLESRSTANAAAMLTAAADVQSIQSRLRAATQVQERVGARLSQIIVTFGTEGCPASGGCYQGAPTGMSLFGGGTLDLRGGSEDGFFNLRIDKAGSGDVVDPVGAIVARNDLTVVGGTLNLFTVTEDTRRGVAMAGEGADFRVSTGRSLGVKVEQAASSETPTAATSTGDSFEGIISPIDPERAPFTLDVRGAFASEGEIILLSGGGPQFRASGTLRTDLDLNDVPTVPLLVTTTYTAARSSRIFDPATMVFDTHTGHRSRTYLDGLAPGRPLSIHSSAGSSVVIQHEAAHVAQVGVGATTKAVATILDDGIADVEDDALIYSETREATGTIVLAISGSGGIALIARESLSAVEEGISGGFGLLEMAPDHLQTTANFVMAVSVSPLLAPDVKVDANPSSFVFVADAFARPEPDRAQLITDLSFDAHVHGADAFESGVPLVDRIRSFLATGVQILSATEHDPVVDFQASAAVDGGAGASGGTDVATQAQAGARVCERVRARCAHSLGFWETRVARLDATSSPSVAGRAIGFSSASVTTRLDPSGLPTGAEAELASSLLVLPGPGGWPLMDQGSVEASTAVQAFGTFAGREEPVVSYTFFDSNLGQVTVQRAPAAPQNNLKQIGLAVHDRSRLDVERFAAERQFQSFVNVGGDFGGGTVVLAGGAVSLDGTVAARGDKLRLSNAVANGFAGTLVIPATSIALGAVGNAAAVIDPAVPQELIQVVHDEGHVCSSNDCPSFTDSWSARNSWSTPAPSRVASLGQVEFASGSLGPLVDAAGQPLAVARSVQAMGSIEARSERGGELIDVGGTFSGSADLGDPATGVPPTLRLSYSTFRLERFEARRTVAEQVSEVTVRGWDPRQRATITMLGAGSVQIAVLRDNEGRPAQATMTGASNLAVDLNAVQLNEVSSVGARAALEATFVSGDTSVGIRLPILAVAQFDPGEGDPSRIVELFLSSQKAALTDLAAGTRVLTTFVDRFELCLNQPCGPDGSVALALETGAAFAADWPGGLVRWDYVLRQNVAILDPFGVLTIVVTPPEFESSYLRITDVETRGVLDLLQFGSGSPGPRRFCVPWSSDGTVGNGPSLSRPSGTA